MKLRLFAIRDTHTNKPVSGLYFPGKPEAKRERDKLNAAENSTNRYVVTTGPDHRRHGNGN